MTCVGSVDRQGVPGERYVDKLHEDLRQQVVEERVLQNAHRLRLKGVCRVLHEIPLKEVKDGVLHRVPVKCVSRLQPLEVARGSLPCYIHYTSVPHPSHRYQGSVASVMTPVPFQRVLRVLFPRRKSLVTLTTP